MSESPKEVWPESGLELSQIAQTAVRLAALGPRLAEFAAEMEAQARSQAAGAREMAETMAALAGDLDRAVAEMRSSSRHMGTALAMVGKIADQTRLLSINASVEAARAGAHGRSFAVIVNEVKALADRTGDSTRTIGERMQEFEANLGRMAAIAAGGGQAGERTVGAVNRQVTGVADSAGRQLRNVESVHEMGAEIKSLTEALLLGVGKFRFDIHALAESEVEGLAAEIGTDLERARLEELLELWLGERKHFEWAYVTDGNGRQLVDNIGWKDGQLAHDPAGYGRDWSDRPWYGQALERPGASSTDVYRSAATGDHCFTISAALRDEAGDVVGVLACDVNFTRLVGN